MKLEVALPIANCLVTALRPACDRIAIAGSVRRKAPEVNDIEIVLVNTAKESRRRGALFPTIHNLALDSLDSLAASKNWDRGRWGQRWRQLIGRPDGYVAGVQVDVFVVHPDGFGFQHAIRTGPAEFSKLLVSRALPSSLRCDGGLVWRGKDIVPVPTEADFFALLGLPMWVPEERTAFKLIQFLDNNSISKE